MIPPAFHDIHYEYAYRGDDLIMVCRDDGPGRVEKAAQAEDIGGVTWGALCAQLQLGHSDAMAVLGALEADPAFAGLSYVRTGAHRRYFVLDEELFRRSALRVWQNRLLPSDDMDGSRDPFPPLSVDEFAWQTKPAAESPAVETDAEGCLCAFDSVCDGDGARYCLTCLEHECSCGVCPDVGELPCDGCAACVRAEEAWGAHPRSGSREP